MKRNICVLLIIAVFSFDLYAQENASEPASVIKEKDYTAEYWLFGTVPAVVLVWGLAAWGWGTADGFNVENDGWGCEQDSYTGGADKWGHAWGIYLSSRIGSYAFERTGDSRTRSAFKGFLFGQFVGFGIEFGDGFGDTYGWAWGDMVWNFGGGVFALMLDLYPPLDNILGFQIEYWPSEDYRNQKNEKKIEITSDVTGQKFIFNFKFSGIPYLRDTFMKYFQIDSGYYTKGYWYHPSSYRYKTRHAYIGFAFNWSSIAEDVLPEGGWRTGASRFFKYYHVPIAYNPDVLDHEFAGKTPSEK